jgi:hypothetical protein
MGEVTVFVFHCLVFFVRIQHYSVLLLKLNVLGLIIE